MIEKVQNVNIETKGKSLDICIVQSKCRLKPFYPTPFSPSSLFSSHPSKYCLNVFLQIMIYIYIFIFGNLAHGSTLLAALSRFVESFNLHEKLFNPMW